MDEKIKITSVIAFLCFCFGCSSKYKFLKKNTNIEGNSELVCDKKSSCLDLIDCCLAYEEVDVDERRDNYNSACKISEYLSCLAIESHNGNLDAQIRLVHFYQNIYTNWIKAEMNPALVFRIDYSHTTRLFGTMRGKEAFELAIQFGQKNEYYDGGDTGSSHVGFVVLEDILFKMIKEVNGVPSFYSYIHQTEKFKDARKIFDYEDPFRHEEFKFYRNELKLAWDEGLIELRDYTDTLDIRDKLFLMSESKREEYKKDIKELILGLHK